MPLPFPAWDLIDMDAYFDAWGQLDSVQPGLRGVNLSGSRGCPFTCTFCAETLHTMFGRKLRQRSPESLVAELVELKKRYNIEAFWLTDDTFTTNRKYVERFCDVLEQSELNLLWGCTTRANLIPEYLIKRMQEVGLRKVGIGLESATERIREGIYEKEVSDEEVSVTVHALAQNGVQTLLFLMLGAPSETRREMLETIRLASASLPATEAFQPLRTTSRNECIQRHETRMGIRSAKTGLITTIMPSNPLNMNCQDGNYGCGNDWATRDFMPLANAYQV